MPAQRAAILVGILLAVSAARADEPDEETAVNKVVELDKKALAMYENLDVAGAAQALEQALALCGGGLAIHPAAARTHLYLGVVYVGGLKKRAEGLTEFKRALAIDPKIQIAKSLVNPEVEAVFAEAMAAPVAPAAIEATADAATAPAEASAAREHLAILHPPVTRGMQGHAVPIKVQVPPGLGAARVVLAYKAEAQDLFLAREMAPIKGSAGWHQEEIPREATRGARVAYYIEAQNSDDQPIANDGTPEAPHYVVLGPEIAVDEEKPAASKDGANAVTGPGLWLVLAIGIGGGYHAGKPEMNPVDNNSPQGDIHVSGFGLARLGHLAPEIGFLPRPDLVISVQGRLQSVSGTQDIVVDRNTYHAAEYAIAGLAKLSWFVRKAQHRLRPFITAQMGAGQIRHTITTPAGANLTGCGDGPTCKDTVVGGLALAGAGAGLTWRLDENLAAYAAFNLLMGVPNFMVNGDLNLGIAVMR
jgi:hypothetical protein